MFWVLLSPGMQMVCADVAAMLPPLQPWKLLPSTASAVTSSESLSLTSRANVSPALVWAVALPLSAGVPVQAVLGAALVPRKTLYETLNAVTPALTIRTLPSVNDDVATRPDAPSARTL